MPKPHKYGCVHSFLEHGVETPECPICQEAYSSLPSLEKWDTHESSPVPPHAHANTHTHTHSHNQIHDQTSDDDDDDEHVIIQIKDCGHYFHKSCLTMWVEREGRNTCPSCRHELFREPTSEDDLLDALEHVTDVTNHLEDLLEEFNNADLKRIIEDMEDDTPVSGLLKRILPARLRRHLGASHRARSVARVNPGSPSTATARFGYLNVSQRPQQDVVMSSLTPPVVFSPNEDGDFAGYSYNRTPVAETVSVTENSVEMDSDTKQVAAKPGRTYVA